MARPFRWGFNDPTQPEQDDPFALDTFAPGPKQRQPAADPFEGFGSFGPGPSAEPPPPAAETAFQGFGGFGTMQPRPAGAGGFQPSATPGAPQPAAQALQQPAGAGRTPGAPAGGSNYQSVLDQIKTAADPRQAAVLRDQLSRQVAADVTAAGHKVSWKGDQLIIDGRPYVIGDGQTPNPAGSPPKMAGRNTMRLPGGTAGEDPGMSWQAPYERGPFVPGQGDTGIVPSHQLPGGTDPRMKTGGPVNESLGQLPLDDEPGAWTAPYERGPQVGAPAAPGAEIPGAPAAPGQPAYSMDTAAPPGFDQTKWVDPNKAATSAKYLVGHKLADMQAEMAAIPPEQRKAWIEGKLTEMIPEIEASGWTVHAVSGEKIQISGGPDNAPAHWVDTVQNAGGANPVPQWYVDDGSGGAQQGRALGGDILGPRVGDGDSELGGHDSGGAGAGAGGGGNEPGQQGANGQFNWQNAPEYIPGDISFDDLDQLPGFEELMKQMQGNPAFDKLLEDLLANPESLDPKTIATMQAKSKDELSGMQAEENEALTAFGYGSGNADSRWLASERAASARDRDSALVASNRNIELEAAKTNTADRRAAAQLGLGAQSTKQQAVATAMNGALQKMALTNDRLALREQVKQEATRLGLAEDELTMRYLVAQMQDATQRYGISVDIRKIESMDSQQKLDIAFRMWALNKQLGEQARQFDYGYGLDFLGLQHQMDEDYYGRYERSQGGG